MLWGEIGCRWKVPAFVIDCFNVLIGRATWLLHPTVSLAICNDLGCKPITKSEDFKNLKKKKPHFKSSFRDFPGSSLARLHLPVQGVWVPSLARELRHSCLVAKKPKRKTEAILWQIQ